VGVARAAGVEQRARPGPLRVGDAIAAQTPAGGSGAPAWASPSSGAADADTSHETEPQAVQTVLAHHADTAVTCPFRFTPGGAVTVVAVPTDSDPRGGAAVTWLTAPVWPVLFWAVIVGAFAVMCGLLALFTKAAVERAADTSRLPRVRRVFRVCAAVTARWGDRR
jgi:hypothetical protein